MERARAAACIVVLVLLAPTALAAQGLVADHFVLAGTTQLEGDTAALFFLSLEDGFSWEASADSATLLREYATYVATDHPLGGYAVFRPSEWQTETIDLDASTTLASSRTIEWGAMLVLGQSAAIRASSEGLVEVRATSDPYLGQVAPAEAETEGGDGGEVAHQFTGDFLNATFAEGTYTLTGDLILLMYGPAYSLTSEGEATEWETGEFETARTLVYAEGRQERHTLTLHNAVLQLRALEPTTILTTYPTLAVDGTLKAPQAEGALVVGGQTIVAPADGAPLTYHGATRLLLANDAGRVAASSADTSISTAGAIAAQGPPILALGAAAVLVVAALVGAVAFLARRTREDDLALALLAMEERRWNDALPRLARVARREPDNVGVLVDRALCLEQVGRFEDAARAFEGALRNAPGLAEAHFYYARTLAKMRQPDAARAHLEEALERDPRLVEMVRAETVLRGL